MSQNGQPADKLSLQQRLAPARVKQLEDNQALQTSLLVQRAMSQLRDLTNDLHICTEQASMGSAAARQTLALLFQNWEAARAAAAGIMLPKA